MYKKQINFELLREIIIFHQVDNMLSSKKKKRVDNMHAAAI